MFSASFGSKENDDFLAELEHDAVLNGGRVGHELYIDPDVANIFSTLPREEQQRLSSTLYGLSKKQIESLKRRSVPDACKTFLAELVLKNINVKHLDIDMLITLTTIDDRYVETLPQYRTSSSVGIFNSQYSMEVQTHLAADIAFLERLYFGEPHMKLDYLRFHFSDVSSEQRSTIDFCIGERIGSEDTNTSNFIMAIRELLALNVPLTTLDFDQFYLLLDEDFSHFSDFIESVQNLHTVDEKQAFVAELSQQMVPTEFNEVVERYSPKKPIGPERDLSELGDVKSKLFND